MALLKSFYNRSPLEVAPELLGKVLVRNLEGQIISGRIIEVEAYLAFVDKAAHGYIGKTKRNESLFGEAGRLYVHSIHMQNCMDIVTEGEGIPSSVLIRGLEPIDGIEVMKKLRNKEKLKDLASGPGKLCQALAIDKTFNGVDVTKNSSSVYVIDDGFEVGKVSKTRRIGLSKGVEEEYRFHI